MAETAKRRASPSEDLDLLLKALCTEWGFCNRLNGEELMQRNQELTASAFASAVLAAEGMNPELEPDWRRKLEAKFIERYGGVAGDGYPS